MALDWLNLVHSVAGTQWIVLTNGYNKPRAIIADFANGIKVCVRPAPNLTFRVILTDNQGKALVHHQTQNVEDCGELMAIVDGLLDIIRQYPSFRAHKNDGAQLAMISVIIGKENLKISKEKPDVLVEAWKPSVFYRDAFPIFESIESGCWKGFHIVQVPRHAVTWYGSVDDMAQAKYNDPTKTAKAAWTGKKICVGLYQGKQAGDKVYDGGRIKDPKTFLPKKLSPVKR